MVLSHESNESAIASSVVNGSAWSLGTSLAVDVPLARRFTLTPEVGRAGGSVRTDVMTTVGAITQDIRSTDDLSGWWTAVDLSVAF